MAEDEIGRLYPESSNCPTCYGAACEEGCGLVGGHCEMAHSGPASHKVCRTCGGSGARKVQVGGDGT